MSEEKWIVSGMQNTKEHKRGKGSVLRFSRKRRSSSIMLDYEPKKS